MNYLNIDEALDRFDNDASFWADFAETWLRTAAVDHKAFIEAIALNDGEGALFHIHKLKGAASTIGAAILSMIGGEIEIALRETRTADVASRLKDYNDVYADTVAETSGFIVRFRKQ